MKRAYGLVLGLSWPIALIVSSLSRASLGNSAFAQVVHGTFVAIAWFDPLAYLHLGTAIMLNDVGVQAGLPGAPQITALLVLALVYGAAAIVQWRRVEA